MRTIKTSDYIKKTAFLPSAGSVGDRIFSVISKAVKSDTVQGLTRGTFGGLKRVLYEATSAESEIARNVADQLKILFNKEFNMAKRNPGSEPGRLMFHIKNMHDVKGYRLTSNQQMIATNKNAFKDFANALKDILVFSEGFGATSGGKNVISMIDATDNLGNPHEKRDRMNQTIIGLFANWLPKYYNDAVIIVTDYCKKNSCP